MANDLSTRQWKLDTPLAFGTAAAVLWKGQVYVKSIVWSGFAANGTLILKDQTGRIIWQENISATDVTLQPVRLGDIGWVNGVVLDTLSGGTVILYTK